MIAASPLASRFDQAAGLIRAVVIPQLQYVANGLRKLAGDWSAWVTNMAPKAFTATAMQAAQAALTKTPNEDKVFDVGTVNSFFH